MKKFITGVVVGALGAGFIIGAVYLIQDHDAETSGQTPPIRGNGYMMQQQVEVDEVRPPFKRHGPGMVNHYRDTRDYGMMGNRGHMEYRPGMMYDYYGMMGYGPGTYHENLANFFGMSEEELFEARLEGKTLLDITEEALVEEITNLLSPRLDELVKDNIITKEQKKLMLDRMVENMIEKEGCGPSNR